MKLKYKWYRFLRNRYANKKRIYFMNLEDMDKWLETKKAKFFIKFGFLQFDCFSPIRIITTLVKENIDLDYIDKNHKGNLPDICREYLQHRRQRVTWGEKEEHGYLCAIRVEQDDYYYVIIDRQYKTRYISCVCPLNFENDD